MSEGLKKHKKRAKGITALAIVATAVILGVAIAAAVMMVSRANEEVTDPKPETSEGAEKPEVIPEGELTEVAIDDPEVQRLYEAFSKANGQLYTDEEVLAGNTDYIRVSLARLNTEPRACKRLATEELLRERYGEAYIDMFGMEKLLEESQECYDGAEVREMVQNLFGVEAELEDGMRTGSFTAGGQPFYRYDAENDEFYWDLLPGGGAGPVIVHALNGAKKDDERLYLYDTVGKFEYCYSVDDVQHYIAGPLEAEMTKREDDALVCKEEYIIDYVGEDGRLDMEEFSKHKEDFDEYRWVFKRNEAGNYIFERLEKVEN